MNNENIQNSISTDELYKEYNWYQNTFPSIVQNSCDEFFDKNFELNFIGLSKNINCLLDNESCFVTKIKLNDEYDIFFRLTDKTIEIILDKILGQSKNKFNINKISDLEAKIITTFNGFMFDALKKQINEPNPVELKRTNFDAIHLTFLLKDIEEDINKRSGKVIITLPQALVTPDTVNCAGPKFAEEDFPSSETFVKIIVGNTRFSLYDIKNLEQDDVVVFDNSSIDNLMLEIQGEKLPVNINPNMDLLIPEDNDGGDDMGDSHKNIWDSIEVDMYAEFDSVKVTLGELKNIENGLVVDLTSLYDNNVTLKVEGKPIASGSLVIVNDRYGVKINNIIAPTNGSIGQPSGGQTASVAADNSAQQQEEEYNNNDNTAYDETEAPTGGGDEGEEEEFDYSDFELEDENI